ncbi:hypothetical protein niasHT_030711 [Heterodera trifolii]|uniref:Myotubularin phosphatase domain-containing protein n=1 Tax=Heterodera trifolii TaxID=157864 RepID=A0ABD2HSW2_9BILA
MPCNDNHLLNSNCERVNNGASAAGAVDDNVFPSSSSDLAIVDATRSLSICNNASSPSAHSAQTPAALSAEQQFNFSRNRSASTRSSLNPLSTFNALHPLPGEEFDSENWVSMESCRVFLTQFRIIVVAHSHNAMCAIPITGVDLLEAKDIVGLQINSKDGRILKLRAENSETACAWYKKLIQKTCIVREQCDVFAFKFFNFCSKIKPLPSWLRPSKQGSSAHELLKKEFNRLKISNTWKISSANKRFEICSSYPQYLIVPASVSDEELKQMRLGRIYYRFPTLVWRCPKNGAVLLRSSQPSIGFFGMSNDKDMHLYERIRSAISNDANMKFLIVDARSYTAAWANRAKGGGFEGADSYANAEVVFMGLANIHNIRYSFYQLRSLMNACGGDPNNYFQSLQSTLWLQYICQLFSATERCLHSLLQEGVSVLVHCSDGWDRTTQIVSLCMIIADPFYRTFEGFEMLVQRQWVEFGHKFSDRGGVLNGDDNEKSPVFLQFLDCVYQLWTKNPDQFQFNRRYLMKLVQHTFSGLFGTFIFNSLKEAAEHGGANVDTDEEAKPQQCYQVWQYLGAHNAEFENPAYNKKKRSSLLRYPKLIQELEPWRDAYCCTPTQSRINNSDDSLSLHHNNGTCSTQDISSEKTNNTLSRSQSAASLHSLEQNGPSSIHASHGAATTYMNLSLSNGANASAALTSKLSGSCSTGSISSLEEKIQEFLDVDGLSKVPTQFEDFIIERDRKKELQTRKASPITGTGTTPTPFVRDGIALFEGRLANVGETSRRTRNESVDSSSFEIVNSHHLALNGAGGECRVKHCSHNSSSSLTSGVCLPSSCSSTCTTLSSEFCSQNGFGCKNEVLRESVECMENGDGDGLEIMLSNRN